MFEQPADFRDESEALHALLREKTDTELAMPTQFKGWTIDNVVGHLHFWNHAADLSLKDGEAFQALWAEVMEEAAKTGLQTFEKGWLGGATGQELLETWRSFFCEMSDRFAAEDPKRRVKWAGPDMSVRSSITARIMETWAHGQEVFDTFGVMRKDTDRIRNIAVLGVNTFGWTFMNRGLDVASEVPHVRLTAPSGEIWEWNNANSDNHIEGSASEFCQVVTQTRNIADTVLQVSGKVANDWMAIAQCFAGPPEEPPAPGVRFMAG